MRPAAAKEVRVQQGRHLAQRPNDPRAGAVEDDDVVVRPVVDAGRPHRGDGVPARPLGDADLVLERVVHEDDVRVRGDHLRGLDRKIGLRAVGEDVAAAGEAHNVVHERPGPHRVEPLRAVDLDVDPRAPGLRNAGQPRADFPHGRPDLPGELRGPFRTPGQRAELLDRLEHVFDRARRQHHGGDPGALERRQVLGLGELREDHDVRRRRDHLRQVGAVEVANLRLELCGDGKVAVPRYADEQPLGADRKQRLGGARRERDDPRDRDPQRHLAVHRVAPDHLRLLRGAGAGGPDDREHGGKRGRSAHAHSILLTTTSTASVTRPGSTTTGAAFSPPWTPCHSPGSGGPP
jgi:hypothetical protein